MEVKPGYKQTEVGVIPADWKLSNLSALSAFITKGSTPTTYGFKWESSGVLFLRSECVAEIGLDRSQSMFISDAAHASLRRSTVKEGDLLVTITGYVGRVVVFRGTEDANINQHIARVRINSPLVCSRFVYHYVSLPQVRSRFNAITTGQAYPQISLKQVRDTGIPLPPTIAEQEAIAEALSDADALIESLEQLLAKKRHLKQGAMQELLAGTKRLPGFGSTQAEFKDTDIGRLPADWPVVEVKQVTRNHKQGYYTKDRYVDAGVKLIRITDLLNPSIDYATMPMLRLSSSDHDLYRVSVGDFLFARSGAIGRYGIVYEDTDAVFGSYIIRFSFDSAKLKNEYFGYLYETEIVWKQLLSITQGSSNININASNIKSIRIPLPYIDEQVAIATILSNLDEEIAVLEAKLAKARQIKQGMMQELLTGRIRLV